ncbi:S8 family serine peptidase, partial [bacterium]|nr:S8 family serine peptidase [bacterium]
GNPRGTDKEEKPIWDAVKTWRDLGIVPIFAAGNSGPGKASMSSPASYPHSIAVGSTNRWRFIHRSSSRGPAQWGGQEFLKPDVVAPGVSILSLDYKGDYTKKTGTSMAAPHVAGIAALMLQARPNLTVDRVADLLRESASQGFQASANNKYGFGLVRAYGALMHLFRENEILLRVNSGDAIASVFVEPYQVRYWTNPKGEVHIFLPEGKYEITANAFGFEPQEFKIKLEKKEKVFKAITLEKAKRYSVEFFVFSPERIPVESSLEFLRTPLPIQNTTGGSLRLKMPEGEYEVLIRSRGYLPLKQEFKIKKKDDFEIELSHLPDVFVVDDDYLNQSEEIYSQSLDESGLSFQSQKNEDGIDRLLMMSFERAIWYTGSTGLNTLTPRDRDLIMDYVRSGGNLILTGQDIGFEIGISKFYRNFLGVEFLKDHADSLKVRFQDQIVDLTEGDNIHYPRSLDVFKPTTASAQVLMTYENGSVAAIINKYDKGKLIYLGFGFEAVQGIAARKKLMQSLMTQLQPSIQERLQRISWAYHNNAELHSILVEKFKPRTQREKKISQKFLESFPQKAPFRAIISNLLHEN